MNLMYFLFFALVALAIFHYLYEGILAPSFKFEARLKLFRLRDDLRRLKIENPKNFTEDLFLDLQEGINRQIHYFDNFSLVNILLVFHSLKGNEEIDKQVGHFFFLLDNCPVPGVKNTYLESIKVFWESVAINSGGWISVILPIYIIERLAFLISFAFTKVDSLKQRCSASLVRHATRILETPHSTFSHRFERAF